MHHDTTAASRQRCPSEPVLLKMIDIAQQLRRTVEERNKQNPN
jgi:hypothetical protein